MTSPIPDPDEHRSARPVERYRANPVTAPGSETVEEKLRACVEKVSGAATEDGGGLPPELDVTIVSGEDSEAQLYVRTYDHDLLEKPGILSAPLPDPLNRKEDSLVRTLAGIVESHGSDPGVKDNKPNLVEQEDLANGLLGICDQVLTIQPARMLQPITDKEIGQSQIDSLAEPDWDLGRRKVNNELDWTYTEAERPQAGLIQELIETIEEVDVGFVCQIHLEFPYDLDGETITVSRASDITSSIDETGQIRPATEFGFGFRLFTFSQTQGVEYEDQLKDVGKQLVPYFPERYTPAIYRNGQPLADHVKRFFQGRGFKQSEDHHGIFRRSLTLVRDWITLPTDEMWYTTGRFLPIEQRFLSEDSAHPENYPLGDDVFLDRPITLPSPAPQRHIVYSDSQEDRQALLSRSIEYNRRIRGPVFVLDWCGDLLETHLSHMDDELLKRHALLDVAEMPLADEPRYFSTQTTTTGAKSTSSINQQKQLYSALFESYTGYSSQNKDNHLQDARRYLDTICESMASIDNASLSHFDLRDEVTHHLARHSSSSEQSSLFQHATATRDYLETLHESLPSHFFGDLGTTLNLDASVPSDVVIWFDLSSFESPEAKRWASTILVDAITRNVPSFSSSDEMDGTVVLDHGGQVPITNTASRVFSSAGDVLLSSDLALVVGQDLRSTDDQHDTSAASAIESDAVKTVHTTTELNTSILPTPLSNRTDPLQSQHATGHSMVALPPDAISKKRRKRDGQHKILAPINPSIETVDSGDSSHSQTNKMQTLRSNGATLTPGETSSTLKPTPTREPRAVHPSRLSSRFSTSQSASNASTRSDGRAGATLSEFTDYTADRLACEICGTRYSDVGDAISCHPNHHQSRSGTNAAENFSITYPQRFVDRLASSPHGQDSLNQFFTGLLTGDAEPDDTDAIRSRIKTGLSDRIDGETYNELSLDVLTFLQMVEAARVGLIPVDESMTDLRKWSLREAEYTIDDLRGTFLEERATYTKYYQLTDLSQTLEPISTFRTAPSTPPTRGLDDDFPVNRGRQLLARQFASDNAIHRVEILHCPNPDRMDTFPCTAVDVAGFDHNQRLRKVGFIPSSTTADGEDTKEMIEWATEVPAEVVLLSKHDDRTQALVSELSSTEVLTLDREEDKKPLPETAYHTSQIKEWITWPPGSDITLQLLSSVYE